MGITSAVRLLLLSRPFSPPMLSGLELWLHGETIAGLAEDAAIATWPDASGKGRNAAQATGSKQPLYKATSMNGRPAARFDGVNDGMDIGDISAAFPAAATLFVAASLTSENGYSLYYTHAANDSWWRFTDGAGYIGVFRTARISGYPAATLPTSGKHVWSLLSSSATYEVWVDGVSKGAQAASYQAGTAHQVGGDDGTNTKWAAADIAEVIAYSRALSASERILVQNYLGRKYGVSF